MAAFSAIAAVVDPARAQRLVAVDLSGCGKLDAKRCRDYLAGVVDATGAELSDLSRHCVLLVPAHASVSAAQGRAVRSYLDTRLPTPGRRRRDGERVPLGGR